MLGIDLGKMPKKQYGHQPVRTQSSTPDNSDEGRIKLPCRPTDQSDVIKMNAEKSTTYLEAIG